MYLLEEYAACPTDSCALGFLSKNLLTLLSDDGRHTESFVNGPSPEPVLEIFEEGGQSRPVVRRSLLQLAHQKVEVSEVLLKTRDHVIATEGSVKV